MPPVQTEYKENMDAARPGAVVNMIPNTTVSRSVEEVGQGFGLPVVQGESDKGARTSKTGDTKLLGISVRDRSAVSDAVPVGHSSVIMRKGAIWVRVVAAVEAGDPVHAIVADATWGKTGGVVLTNARYETSAASGEMAQVYMG